MRSVSLFLRSRGAALAVAAFMFLGGACPVPAQAASFDPNRLIDDADFVAVNALSVAQVQQFLVRQGGFLANYSENGRTAAQIIVDAAHGAGDASGSINGVAVTPSTGTVNPAVILVTLQKEQGLVTMKTQNDNSLRAAMGYSCPDSGGCNPAYVGFTKQVENGAWQLRYNYEAAGQTAAWRTQYYGGDSFPRKPMFPGDSVTLTNTGKPDQTVTVANRATSSLYRYTPHVYNGNFSFWTLYTNWFNQLTLTVTGLDVDTHGGILGTETHATVRFRYQSDSAHALTVAVIARRKDASGAYSQNFDFGSAGPWTMNDGDEFTWQARRALPEGDYLVYGAYLFGGEWYPLTGVSRTFTIRPPQLTAGYGATADFVRSGTDATVRVTLTNAEAFRVYYAGFGLAARDAQGRNFDFPAVANEYLDPGQSKTLTFSRSLPDGDYTLFPIYKIDTPAWYASPAQFRLSVWPDELYKLRFNDLRVDQPTAYWDQPTNVRFTVTNPTDHMIVMPRLRMAGRRFAAQNVDFGMAYDVEVPAGATIPIHFEQVFGQSGQYSLWPIYRSGNGIDWVGLKPAGTSPLLLTVY